MNPSTPFLGARFQRLLDLTHRFLGRKTGWTGDFCWLLSGVITVDGGSEIPRFQQLRDCVFVYSPWIFRRNCVTNHEVWGGVRFSR